MKIAITILYMIKWMRTRVIMMHCGIQTNNVLLEINK